MRFLILALLIACGAENSSAPRTEHPPANSWKGILRLLTAAGPHVTPPRPVDERGDVLTIDWPGKAHLHRGIHSTKPDNSLEIIAHCSATGSIWYHRADTTGMPAAWTESLDGRIPAGPRILHIRMDGDLCLVARKFPEPVVSPRMTWISRITGNVTPITEGECGDSPDWTPGEPCAVARLRVELRPMAQPNGHRKLHERDNATDEYLATDPDDGITG